MEKTSKKSCTRTGTHYVFGVIFIVLATILTLVTLSGFGILGLFAVGISLLCCHNHCCSKSDSSCHTSACDIPAHHHHDYDAEVSSCAVPKTTHAAGVKSETAVKKKSPAKK
jgi:hypothetical protein